MGETTKEAAGRVTEWADESRKLADAERQADIDAVFAEANAEETIATLRRDLADRDELIAAAKEFAAAGDDASWGEESVIFRMAADNDQLRLDRDEAVGLLENAESYMTEKGVSHEYPVLANIRTFLARKGDDDENAG